MSAIVRPIAPATAKPAMPSHDGDEHLHDHDHAAHAPIRRRPTALASSLGDRLIRIAIALAVLWLAVAWALWWG